MRVMVFWEGDDKGYKIWVTREQFEDMQVDPSVRNVWEVEG